jgi:hypothetical protein
MENPTPPRQPDGFLSEITTPRERARRQVGNGAVMPGYGADRCMLRTLSGGLT